ncbi:RodZ domain-containing protein [Shewanella indica]|uniref:RodZ domain-containing protein n=1 Tax=Shewanella indica TaxID=768528 RepID=UPI001BEF15B0|nr:RodZ domain-containing protein [Shewanella indica]BCV36044.1 transcriptional regulator [Shewanella chilikensis]
MTELNNQVNKDEDENPKVPGQEDTLGSLLKSAREQKGITVEDAATRLHLRPCIVTDIEADCFSNIDSSTYVRGYVKNYARILGVDKEAINNCLARQVPKVTEPAMQSFSRKTSRQATDSRLMLVTYLIGFLLLALLVVWWLQKPSVVSDVDFSQPTAEEVQQAREFESRQAQIAETELPPETSTETPTAEVEKSLVEDNNTDEANSGVVNSDVDMTEQPVATEATQASVGIELDGDCWIKLTDANGKTLIDGLRSPGQTIRVQGKAPFKLVLGAPQTVSLTFNGQAVSLADFPSGRVARLTLPQA